MGEYPDYSILERRLIKLLDDLHGELSLSERNEVLEFVDVGEYGIGLETLSSLIVEEGKCIPSSTFEDIAALAGDMGIGESVITDSLRARVKRESD